MADGFADRRLDDARLGHEVVGERREARSRRGRAARRPGSAGSSAWSPLPIAETSSGPKARAGFSDAPVIGPTTMMIAIDDAADDEAGEVAGRARVDDPEDREHQHERADALGEDRRGPGRRVLVERRLAHAEVDRRCGRRRAQMPSAPMHGADDLRGPVGRDLAPGEALGDGERERDRGVDVTARDLADRVDERRDDQPEGERDAEQVGARDRGRRLARERSAWRRPIRDRPAPAARCRASRRTRRWDSECSCMMTSPLDSDPHSTMSNAISEFGDGTPPTSLVSSAAEQQFLGLTRFDNVE